MLVIAGCPAEPVDYRDPMQGFGLGTILLLALLPVLGNLIGVGLAEWREPSRWLTGAAMHAAAGIGTAVAALELAPRAQDRIETWMLALAIFAGAMISVGLARLTLIFKRKLMEGGSRATTWGAFAAVGVDLFTRRADDRKRLGYLRQFRPVARAIPGTREYAGPASPSRPTSAQPGFRAANGLGQWQSIQSCRSLAQRSANLVLQGAGDLLVGLALALFAGLLLTATVEDIIPEADEPGTARRISKPILRGWFYRSCY